MNPYRHITPVNFVDPSGLILVMAKYSVQKNGGTISYDASANMTTITMNGITNTYTDLQIINGRAIIDHDILAKDFGIDSYRLKATVTDQFETQDDAALAWGLQYNPISTQADRGVEWQAYIYENSNGTFSYDGTTSGYEFTTEDGQIFRTVNAAPPNPNRTLAAWMHTHGAYPDPNNPTESLDVFTGRNTMPNGYTIGDGSYSHALGVGGYLFSPGGRFRYLDHTLWANHEQVTIPDDDPAVRKISDEFPR